MKLSKTLRNLGLLYLVVMVLILTLGSFLQTRSFSLGLIGTEIVCILLPALVYLRLTRTPLASLGFKLPGPGLALLCLLLGLSTFMLGALLDSLSSALFGYSVMLPASAFPANTFQAVLLFLALAVSAALCEEVLYRGVVLRGLAGYGARFAIVLTSLLFAFFHFRLQGLLGLLPVAFLLTYVAWRTGSLPAAMLLHFANNAAASLLLIYNTFNPGGPLLATLGPVFLAGIPLLALGVWLLVRFTPSAPVEPAPTSKPDRPVPARKAEKYAPKSAGIWPFVLAALLFLVMAGMEWVSQKDPRVLASFYRPVLPVPGKTAEGHLRFDITNVIGNNVGHVNYQLINLTDPTVIASEQVVAFQVQYQGGTWLSSGYGKTWSTQGLENSYATSFDWQFHTGDEQYTAQSDGAQASLRFDDQPAQSLTLNGTPVLEEELLLRVPVLPFEQGYARLIDVVHLDPQRTDSRVEQKQIVYTVLGGEPIRTSTGVIVAWKVKIGDDTTAWYDRDAPHKLLRYQWGGLTYSLR